MLSPEEFTLGAFFIIPGCPLVPRGRVIRGYRLGKGHVFTFRRH